MHVVVSRWLLLPPADLRAASAGRRDGAGVPSVDGYTPQGILPRTGRAGMIAPFCTTLRRGIARRHLTEDKYGNG